jgi:hypothetical protein
MLLQPPPELVGAAVEGIGEHPPRWDARLQCPLEHPLGQLDLVGKSHLLGNTGLGPLRFGSFAHCSGRFSARSMKATPLLEA